MKKFIFKTILFISPIFFLHIFFTLFYSTDKGDLFRLGYVMDILDYNRNTIFKKEFDKKKHFKNISEINLNNRNEYTVLTIGDSFSEQENSGYQNYLSEKENISVLHYDRFLHSDGLLKDNQLQALNDILNGDILNKIKVEYIILQSVERLFAIRGKNIKTNDKVHKDSIINSITKHSTNLEKENSKYSFFSKEIIKFPLYNIFYHFNDKGYNSPIYIVKTTENLFSVKYNKNRLLFYFEDLENVAINNDSESVLKLNRELNNLAEQLKKKGIKLIVLPSPDKYDFYYEYIIDKKKYPKPLFFEHLEKMPKKYLYVDSKKIIKSEMKEGKDMYFYDDTHWSPWASKILSNELAKIINHK